jgi:hypothetical protein
MSSILTDYSDSTSNIFVYLFVTLFLIIFTLFVPIINNNNIRLNMFKIIILILILKIMHIICSKSIPIIMREKSNLLTKNNQALRKNLSYYAVLLLFLVALIWAVITMNV